MSDGLWDSEVRVLKVLDRPMTLQQVYEATGATKRTVRAALSNLIGRGMVTKRKWLGDTRISIYQKVAPDAGR